MGAVVLGSATRLKLPKTTVRLGPNHRPALLRSPSVIAQGHTPRSTRSYKEGRLLHLLAADLPGYWVEQASPGRARFVPVNGGPVIEVRERVHRRFLGHDEVAQFEVRTAVAVGLPARLQIRHTGRLRRGGVRVDVVQGDDPVRELAAVLQRDGAFVAAVTPLDFTRFDLARDGPEWVATVELTAASYVSLVLPPIRTYVRLEAEQRVALVDSLSALRTVIRQES